MRRLHAIAAGVLILLVVDASRACNVPVFRYALERWKPDLYQIYVFHRGALGKEDAALVKKLGTFGPAGDVVSNVDLTLINLDKTDDKRTQKLFESLGKVELPYVAIQMNNLDRDTVTVWSGKLDARAVDVVLKSPARQELVKRLAAGQIAVWVMLENGDKKQDDAAAELLEKELKRVAAKLKLPKLTDDPEDRLIGKGPPLKVEFSILRIKRDDAAEMMLRTMLLKSEDDIAMRTEPMAFPVFGRGRTLGGLIGKGLTPENIEEGCAILVAPCSCKFKFQSPGFDLLVTTDWDAIFSKGK